MTYLIIDTTAPVYFDLLDRRVPASAPARPSGLGTLASSQFDLVMTDVGRSEIADRGPLATRQRFKAWQQANPGAILVVPTATGRARDGGLIPRDDAGEVSIVEILDPANTQFAHINQQPWLLATNDRKFPWAKHGITEDRILGLVPLINVLYQQGTIPEAEYKVTRDILQQVLPHLPGVGSRPGKPSELYTDAQMNQPRFHTPVIVPAATDVHVTQTMGKPIRPAKP